MGDSHHQDNYKDGVEGDVIENRNQLVQHHVSKLALAPRRPAPVRKDRSARALADGLLRVLRSNQADT